MAALPVELLEGKLLSPAQSRAPVPRTDLIRRLEGAEDAKVITILAPPGFGKTTLLTQWLAADPRPFAWISVDERDNDPVVFLTYIAVALNQVSPIDGGVFDALATASPSIEGQVIPRLSNAVSKIDAPVVLVLDDLHSLTEPRCLDALSTLILRLTGSVQVAIAGRAEPDLPLPRMRVDGTVLDIGPQDLVFDASEAKLQLHDAGVDLPDSQIEALLESTEGWPAGLYMAALSMRAKSKPSSPSSFAGDDPFVSDYLRAEFLDGLPPLTTSFLVQTSVLEEMSGALCDAILERTGSAAVLQSLSRQNLLVIPQDRHGERYRYHHLFRDLLLTELQRQEPGLEDRLRRRAAAWHEAEGHLEHALEYAQASNDGDHAADLFSRVALSAYRSGRLTTVSRWLKWFDERNLFERYPTVALMGAWLYTLTGRVENALNLSALAKRIVGDEPLADGITPAAAWAAQLEALMCRKGIATMMSDAELAFSVTPEASSQRATALLIRGMARLLAGDEEAAETDLVDASDIGRRMDALHAVVVALAERAVLAIRHGDWDMADALVAEALSCIQQHGLEDYPTSALAYAASAHVAFHRRGDAAARDSLVRAQRLRSDLTHSVPWLAVQVRVELGRAYLAMADPAGSRTVIREAEAIFRHRPDLGTLRVHLDELKSMVQNAPATPPGISTLTAAELRLLPLLATHLSFPEIGERLFVSRHTVKSQAISIYRKLGVSSRSDAVGRAAELGLLER